MPPQAFESIDPDASRQTSDTDMQRALLAVWILVLAAFLTAVLLLVAYTMYMRCMRGDSRSYRDVLVSALGYKLRRHAPHIPVVAQVSCMQSQTLSHANAYEDDCSTSSVISRDSHFNTIQANASHTDVSPSMHSQTPVSMLMNHANTAHAPSGSYKQASVECQHADAYAQLGTGISRLRRSLLPVSSVLSVWQNLRGSSLCVSSNDTTCIDTSVVSVAPLTTHHKPNDASNTSPTHNPDDALHMHGKEEAQKHVHAPDTPQHGADAVAEWYLESAIALLSHTYPSNASQTMHAYDINSATCISSSSCNVDSSIHESHSEPNTHNGNIASGLPVK